MAHSPPSPNKALAGRSYVFWCILPLFMILQCSLSALLQNPLPSLFPLPRLQFDTNPCIYRVSWLTQPLILFVVIYSFSCFVHSGILCVLLPTSRPKCTADRTPLPLKSLKSKEHWVDKSSFKEDDQTSYLRLHTYLTFRTYHIRLGWNPTEMCVLGWIPGVSDPKECFVELPNSIPLCGKKFYVAWTSRSLDVHFCTSCVQRWVARYNTIVSSPVRSKT